MEKRGGIEQGCALVCERIAETYDQKEDLQISEAQRQAIGRWWINQSFYCRTTSDVTAKPLISAKVKINI